MEALTDIMSDYTVPLAGLFAGILLGYVARLNRFCTMAAFERYWYAGDTSPIRTWALAGIVAMAGTQLLIHFFGLDIGSSFYLDTDFGLTGAVLGGLMFGFGMALVGTCGFGAVLRLGGGNLRALVVLTSLGLAALATQRGLMGQVRIALVDDWAIDLSFAGSQSVGDLLSAFLGFDATAAVAIVFFSAAMVWIFKDSKFRGQPVNILTGIVVGLIIPFGWLVTATAPSWSYEAVQVEAASFIVPVGDTIMHIITYTGTVPDYGIGLVVGTLFGAMAAAWHKNDVRWEACDDARELWRHLAGATLMGIGGVFAMGCTIGQGLAAFSTLAISAPIVMVSVAIGARIGLNWLIEGTLWPGIGGQSRGAA